MRNSIRSNTTLSEDEARDLLDTVANESLFGVDAGREPPVARIARINMYLHGDGGSRIYAADSLDKTAKTAVEDDPQSRVELDEWRSRLQEIARSSHNGFDVVLSNPPFSMGYSDKLENEAEILSQYELAGNEESKKRRASLTSNIMFLERYAELLKPGGRLLTVIDDSVLSSPKLGFARDFIRKHFVIRAVISLPGDAFQRVGARAKTSVLYLTRRVEDDTSQPDAFMYECQYVGLDDKPIKTRPSVAANARDEANSEMQLVLEAYANFQQGRKSSHLVPSARLTGRLDVKHCLPRANDLADDWKRDGLEILTLEQIVDAIGAASDDSSFNPQELDDQSFTLLRVRYDGVAEEGERALGGELTYSQVQHPQAGDLVSSNIAVGLGSTCVFPKELEHTIVSHEFTIMRVKDERFHVWFLWGYLRSTEVRARLLSSSSGTNRQRVGWDDLRKLPVPLVDFETQKDIGERYKASINAITKAEKDRKDTSHQLNNLLNLENNWAVQRLKTAKPPK